MSAAAPSPFRGVAQIVRFNWPQYAVAMAAILAGMAILRWVDVPQPLAWALGAFIGMSGFWTIASLVASWWVYDLAGVGRCAWAPALFERPPARCVGIHAGFDEASEGLRAQFPNAAWTILDLFDPSLMQEASLLRARRLQPPHGATPASATALPIASGAADATFLVFAAHEIRQAPMREALFREIARALAPGGRVIVCEHGRDLPNFLVFGPGFWHFLPPREWKRCAAAAGLRLISSARRTPFVVVFAFERER